MTKDAHENVKLDSVNLALIDLLVKDANQSSKVLAKQLNLSSSTVRRRIENMMQHGVLHIIALPEPTKIGLPLRAILAFDVAHEKLNSVMEVLGRRTEIKWLSATTGRYDIIAIAWFRSTAHLFSFMEQDISKLEGIRNSETFISLHVEKTF